MMILKEISHINDLSAYGFINYHIHQFDNTILPSKLKDILNRDIFLTIPTISDNTT
jgi:hypothetical protein